MKHPNIRIIGVPEEEDKKKGHEKILEEIRAENFPQMGKAIVTPVHETQRVPNRIKPRQNTLRSTKQKTNKETQTLNDTMDQLAILIDIFRTFHPKTVNFTFFSSAHGTFSRIHHILGHKSSLGKFKTIEIIPVIFSDHNAVRLDLNYRKNILKIPTYGG